MAYDDVGLFGLDEDGYAVGMNPLYGAAIGAGVGALVAAAVRQMSGPDGAVVAPATTPGFAWHQNSALVGAAAGIAAGGVMAAFPGTRHAGWVAMLTAALSQGITALEAYLSKTPVFAGLGSVVLQRRQTTMGNAQLQPRTTSVGLSGPQLLGRGQLLGMGRSEGTFRSYGATSRG